jgi:hypothetical protein
MTFILMHLLLTALLIFLGYCLGRADGAMADARRKVGAGRTAPDGHNAVLRGEPLAASPLENIVMQED